MDRFRTLKRIQVDLDEATQDYIATDETPTAMDGEVNNGAEEEEDGGGMRLMGVKVARRRALVENDCGGDYVGVDSDKHLSRILSKQGDTKVLFADYILKLTGSGKTKKQILIITNFALYLIDPDSDSLRRRIALAAVDSVCMSDLRDNFLAIIAPSEYDCLFATSRKKEIADAVLEATRSASDGYQIEIIVSNRFEYHAADDLVKEIVCEETDGYVRTRITNKGAQ